MAFDPLTGQVDYGGASYDPQNLNASIGMRAAARADVAPGSGVFDLLESLPGVTTSALFNARRYAKTLERGGRFDVAAGTTGRKLKRAQKYGAMIGDQLAGPDPTQFIGGGKRGPLGAYARRRISQGKTPLLRSARVNNATMRPGAINRLTSLGALAGDAKVAYTPMQGTSGLMDFALKSERIRARLGLAADFDPAKDKAFSGGVLGRITSINRINTLESIVARGPGTSKFSQARYARATQGLDKIAQNALKVGNIANPVASTPSVVKAGLDAAEAARAALPFGPITPTGSASVLNAQRVASQAAIATEEARRMAMATNSTAKYVASEMTTGTISNRITSAFGGAVNYANASSVQTARFYRAARSAGLDATDARSLIRDFSGTRTQAARYVGGFAREMSGAFKMGQIGFKAMTSGGGKVAVSAGARVAASGVVKGVSAMVPGLNVLATGQLIYDLAKGAGKIAVKGVNFAKDALKSMQGTINKPMFGTGFKDNEVAATSRSRGVMAIQNSRLNARSLLGSEASMLAAHFG